MYTIGEFSQITSITVKALRLYHDKGILEPSHVDTDTNYRYYRNSDIEKAHVITALKSLNFSLAEIHDVVSLMTEDGDLTRILKKKKADISNKIVRLNEAATAIDSILIKEKEASTMSVDNPHQVQIKMLAEIQVLATGWQGKYSETGLAMKKLYRAAGRHTAGPALNLYFDGEYKDIANVESCLPIKRKLDGNLECKTLEGGTFATLVHQGPYETIGKSYAKLYEFINAQDKQSHTPYREVYLKGPGMIFKGNPAKYLTEIQMPINE